MLIVTIANMDIAASNVIPPAYRICWPFAKPDESASLPPTAGLNFTSPASTTHGSGVQPIPRDTQGRYQVPAGTLVNSGDTVLVSQHNPAFLDVAEALTNSLDRNGSGGMRANLNMGSNRVTNASAGVASSDLATVGQASLPAGIVLDFAGSVAPTGYLLCFGQAVSRATYSALFAAIGTTYGAGDSTTTFNVPDARGRVTAGKDDMGGTAASRLTTPVAGATLGATGGAQAHVLVTGEMPAHTHDGTTGSAGSHQHDLGGGWSGGATDGGGSPGGINVGTITSQYTGLSGTHEHSLTTNSAGGGGGHNNTQPTIVFNKIIRTGVS